MNIERIYIPTVRRAENQITFNNLPDELKKRVVMVVEPRERHLYNYDCEYLEIPEKLVGTWTQLAETRLFIHKHAGPIKYCVADDDIIIRKRNSKYWSDTSDMEKSKRDATQEEILRLYETVDKWFDEPDIGVVGLSDCWSPPSSDLYNDTKDVYSYTFCDGRMISKIIDDIDICSLRIAEDVLFLFEILSRGINTRRSTEFMYDNRSQVDKKLKNTREIWSGMYEEENRPDDFFQTKEHYDALRYIQKKYPHAVKIYEKDGKMKNTKYWKKVYKSKNESSLENLFT